MGTRSLQASPKGIEKANLALAQYSLSQNALAEDLGLSRQTVNNFFKGKAIDRENFALICYRLGLDLENTVALNSLASKPNELGERSNLDALVQEVRQKTYASIQKRCGTMRVLDMEQPISLDSIYTKVNILEKVSRNQRRTIAELLEGCDVEDFDRFTLGRVSQKRVPGLEAVQRHDKLLILGKPGAGKTTFLKWLMIQCNEGQLHPNRVPMFITMKEFAEQPGQPSLQVFICSQFEACGIDDAMKTTETLLQEGRSLVLLDGLDEVRDVDHNRLLQEICNTSAQFHASQFVVTCRIAAREYTFQQFTEVEVADFDDEQIAEFSRKWFDQKDPIKAEQFPKELEAHEPLKELATNPLLLTLLCLVFEERAGFPANRAELYKEGLDVLLKKWDAKRNIRRDEVYKDLSLKRKEDLLSQIAFTTFEKSEYFFKQKVVEQKIEQYIRNLPNASTDPEALQIDSEAVLKSIEAQHGLLVERARNIYSFSHLTFHEYFTARRIEKHKEHSFLTSHLTEKRWREVILLTVGMLEEADSLLLLMKFQIDEMVASDKEVQQFLDWVQHKTCSMHAPYKPAAIRALYFYLDLDLDLDRASVSDLALDLASASDSDLALDLALDLDLDHALNLNLALASDHALTHALDLDLTRALARALALDLNLDLAHALALDLALNLTRAFALARALALALEPALKQSLKELRDQFPDFSNNIDWQPFQQWWRIDGSTWIAKLRAVMINHRNIGHDWQFSDDQQKQLQQYYDTNKLLIDCPNSDCYVSREVREKIEASLLLPIAELKHHFPNQLKNFSTS
ncbi:NACHT domain-containing NTPase [Trichocoleus sp. FACHB-262]|uniref:NACHT domain-containing protein n=1 Tax=Trichocoleus sp. FACHB-262 TaxID=2692869 RepID=UPI0016892355|nr:NACHT domain-containing NTPase [Trichocoleus sp. FACHB-262]MBD2120188.1 NACHT domain-containing NTPase [Trichocoleus sp. FACHB-262]